MCGRMKRGVFHSAIYSQLTSECHSEHQLLSEVETSEVETSEESALLTFIDSSELCSSE